MSNKRVSLGFDLRINPQLQSERSWQRSQLLVPDLSSPISADRAVWLTSHEMKSLWPGTIPSFANPLNLAKKFSLLEEACARQSIPTKGLWPICITSHDTNIIALDKRYGPSYFEHPPEERQLLSEGWRLLGFDIVDLDRLISGLKGCGYVEPSWSLLRSHFGNSLNTFGLFDDRLIASQFAEVQALEIREHAPFTVAGVLTHDPLT